MHAADPYGMQALAQQFPACHSPASLLKHEGASSLKGFWRSIRRNADPARLLIASAAMAQQEGRFRDAAAFYAEALRVRPGRGPLHVQAGHMFKEAGNYDLAEEHYLRALGLMPNDADLALQLGHFYKTVGRLPSARNAYARAAELAPDWSEPAKQLTNMDRAGWGPGAPGPSASPLIGPGDPDFGTPGIAQLASSYADMAVERLRRAPEELLGWSEPSTTIAQFGVTMNSFWGDRRVARGLEAIRGFRIDTGRLTTVTAIVSGLTLVQQPLKGPYTLAYEIDRERIHKYVFNLWCDFSAFAPGPYTLELLFREGGALVAKHAEDFVVEWALLEAAHPDCDAIVTLDPEDVRSIEEQINTRPSVVHAAVGTTPPAPPRSILVMRTDQLGDMVASIPALLRLRALFPDARLVGLLGPANVDLARTLDVFDEVIAIDFRESMVLRTRTLDWKAQRALRAQLVAYRFDIAIDLATSVMSRPLLALSGAAFLYGFEDPAWPRLTASVDDAWRDPKTGRETATHATRVLALIERLPLLFASNARVLRRDGLSRVRLAALGIDAGERFAVLHTGARIVFSRWSQYPALAARLHHDTDLKVVVFSDQPDWRDTLPPDVANSDRIVVIERQLQFDDFDTLLSFCSVYVGNDSGPKHLAALRGVPVVSIHSARTGWREWGQEQTGVIVSRKVPCAGCSIYHDVDECGKDFVCMTAIGLDEVYAVVRRYV